jgi:DNA repair photolyase
MMIEPRTLLRPVTAGPGERVMGMDVAEGCGGGCIHCDASLALEKYGEEGGLRVDVTASVRLRDELGRLAAQGERPSLMRLGQSSDPFWPDPAVLAQTRACIQVAFEEGVPVEVWTRSVVPDELAAYLSCHPHMARVVSGMMTLRESAARVYEPELASPQARLRSLRVLVHRGVPVTVRVEPLVPLVNDTEADLEALLQAAAKNGIKRVELGYLQMTPESVRSLSRRLPRMHREMLKGLFASESWVEGPLGPRKLLPKVLREAGYERALSVARRCGVMAAVRAELEPEYRVPRATKGPRSGDPVGSAVIASRQLGLFAGAPAGNLKH